MSINKMNLLINLFFFFKTHKISTLFIILNELFINYDAEVIYHYEGISGIVKTLIKIFYPKAAPQFSLVLKKKIL